MPEADEVDRAPFGNRHHQLGLEVRSNLLGDFGLRRRCALRSGLCILREARACKRDGRDRKDSKKVPRSHISS